MARSYGFKRSRPVSGWQCRTGEPMRVVFHYRLFLPSPGFACCSYKTDPLSHGWWASLELEAGA